MMGVRTLSSHVAANQAYATMTTPAASPSPPWSVVPSNRSRTLRPCRIVYVSATAMPNPTTCKRKRELWRRETLIQKVQCWHVTFTHHFSVSWWTEFTLITLPPRLSRGDEWTGNVRRGRRWFGRQLTPACLEPDFQLTSGAKSRGLCRRIETNLFPNRRFWTVNSC